MGPILLCLSIRTPAAKSSFIWRPSDNIHNKILVGRHLITSVCVTSVLLHACVKKKKWMKKSKPSNINQIIWWLRNYSPWACISPTPGHEISSLVDTCFFPCTPLSFFIPSGTLHYAQFLSVISSLILWLRMYSLELTISEKCHIFYQVGPASSRPMLNCFCPQKVNSRLDTLIVACTVPFLYAVRFANRFHR